MDDMTDDARRFAEMMDQRPELAELRARPRTTGRDMCAFAALVLGVGSLISGVILTAFEGGHMWALLGVAALMAGILAAGFLARPRN